MSHPLYGSIVALLLLSQSHIFALAVDGIVGVNYGMNGDSLPPPDQVIAMFKSKNIQRMRIFEPNTAVLQSLQGSGIQLILGVENNDLVGLASDPSFASTWVQANVAPYASTVAFRCISLGNEVMMAPYLAQFVLQAMKNIKNALHMANLTIPVSTAVQENVVSNSYPPSAAEFDHEAAQFMVPVVQFLEENKYPLLCNIYPYFSYVNDHRNVGADFALLTNKEVVLRDNSFGYANMLDAKVDAIYWALEKVGAGSVEIVLSETGWPSGGGEREGGFESVGNAGLYVNNLILLLKSSCGTPKRPGKGIEAYIFAMFNENLKPDGVEQNWGLFYPNLTQIYHVVF